jgi:hypothetical protein
LKRDFDIKTLLKLNSEKMIDPLPREKLSSKDESLIVRRELAEI